MQNIKPFFTHIYYNYVVNRMTNNLYYKVTILYVVLEHSRLNRAKILLCGIKFYCVVLFKILQKLVEYSILYLKFSHDSILFFKALQHTALLSYEVVYLLEYSRGFDYLFSSA